MSPARYSPSTDFVSPSTEFDQSPVVPDSTSPEDLLPPPVNRRPGAAQSSREVAVNIEAHISRTLGRTVANVKHRVMSAAVEGREVGFNKYSGIAEWQNAFFLWVNIGGDDFENMWLDEGERITWFAGAKQSEKTPAVHRLLKAARKSGHVVLYCRPRSDDGRSWGDYVCCGRLEYEQHDATKLPIQFLWRLRDYKQLRSMLNFKRVLLK
eukprot:TRINITY_DN26450_c0_g1_i2.p1 TRINITY_DN26450_c0_g1~~TRINITY_DN26450_c0_g1_i2.p1  ORF type:complete len:210 (-),score=28.20 TRINITY_DN26450_c0_g1_i2:192-821(-)